MRRVLFVTIIATAICSTGVMAGAKGVDEIVAEVSGYATKKYSQKDERIIAVRFVEQKRKLMLAKSEAEAEDLGVTVLLETMCNRGKGVGYKEKVRAIKTDINAQFDKHIPPSMEKELDAKWGSVMRGSMNMLKTIANMVENEKITEEQAIEKTCKDHQRKTR